ncbi:aldehyde dehydrogenase [Mycoplasmopsis canis UF31]|nr:aldehyde dehydrogenase [Mycoplasmopsis canis UF31]
MYYLIMLNSRNFQVFQKQKNDYLQNGEIPINKRIEILKKLKEILLENQDKIEKALWDDLRRTENQSFYSELSLVFLSLKNTLKNIKKWTKKQKIKTPWFLKPSRSFVNYEAHGVVGIYSPWNFPFILALDPLIASIVAGNRTMLKVSEFSINSSKLIFELINQNFDEKLIYCSSNEQNEFEVFNKLKFDFIFFTGSTNVGKIIAKRAAEDLIPVVLELGGKSPTIIFEDANLKNAAKTIAFGKFINSGQICVTHDFLVVHENIADKFQQYLINEFKYLKNISGNGKIISSKHFQRLIDLLPENLSKTISKNLEINQIDPIVFESSIDDKVMKEEIFGPFLPLIKFKNTQDLKDILSKYPNPLALYIFTKSSKNLEIQKSFKAGTVIVNDTISFLSNYNLPFGGIQNSGLGKYHGYEGFKAFSNAKSFYKTPHFIGPSPLVYSKETKTKKKILEWIFK